MMPNHWRRSTWGDEVTLNYGKAIRGYSEADGAYRVFGTNGPVGWHDEALADGPGVILGRKGAYRGVHFTTEPFWVIDTAYFITPLTELDMRWLYYAIKYHKLGEIDDGSPIPSTTRAAVYVKDVDIPPLTEQKSIVHVLALLDDKIEANQRMNETLEAMAQAIFRDWFVDFGPVRRKQEGATDPVIIMGGVTHNAEDAGCLADLFPNVFGDNRLPVGWKHRALSEFSEIQNGFAFKSKDWAEFGVPVVKIGSIRPGIVDLDRVGFVSESIANAKRRFEIPVGAALVGLTGYVGEVGRVPPTDVLPLLNQRVGRFMPRGDSDFSPFVYCASRMPEFKDYAISQAHGSAQPNVSTRSLLQYEIAIGDESLVHAYNELLAPLFDLQITKHGENKTLAETRDLLLPRLMSGEITLKNAEAAA